MEPFGGPPSRLAVSQLQPAGSDFDHGGIILHLGKERRIGSGHPHLRPEFAEFHAQGRATRGIEIDVLSAAQERYLRPFR